MFPSGETAFAALSTRVKPGMLSFNRLMPLLSQKYAAPPARSTAEIPTNRLPSADVSVAKEIVFPVPGSSWIPPAGVHDTALSALPE